ncbi:hypothetical protein E2C01_034541 [Portunus trituberculatus]|uniref:Uncharacterized protein n=1 Tax=Portunus trituberculatus TaxID=210409 RepID=A0A5B7F8S3_PORTR|nr:hypothetical protein [Portunus trituberculatus]
MITVRTEVRERRQTEAGVVLVPGGGGAARGTVNLNTTCTTSVTPCYSPSLTLLFHPSHTHIPSRCCVHDGMTSILPGLCGAVSWYYRETGKSSMNEPAAAGQMWQQGTLSSLYTHPLTSVGIPYRVGAATTLSKPATRCFLCTNQSQLHRPGTSNHRHRVNPYFTLKS